MNYYERHIGDYVRDTAHLSLLEHGIYSRLLDVYYARESGIPDEQVYRLIGAKNRKEKHATHSILREFFELHGSAWIHGRCESEIGRYREKSRKASVSAVKRWESEKGNMRTHSDGNANALRTHSDGNALQTPDTSNQTPVTSNQSKSTAARKAGPTACEDFELLYSLFPKRAGANPRGRAISACNARLAEGHTWAEMQDGARRYAEFIRATGKERSEFVRQLATFVGPDKSFLEPWIAPASRAEVQQDANISAGQEWLRRTA